MIIKFKRCTVMCGGGKEQIDRNGFKYFVCGQGTFRLGVIYFSSFHTSIINNFFVVWTLLVTK